MGHVLQRNGPISTTASQFCLSDKFLDHFFCGGGTPSFLINEGLLIRYWHYCISYILSYCWLFPHCISHYYPTAKCFFAIKLKQLDLPLAIDIPVGINIQYPKKIEKYVPTLIVWSYMIWLYGCFLEWGYPTMDFNTKSWSSMTWMIWGTPIFGNQQKKIANLRYPKISNSELASRYSPTIEFQGRRCDPNSVAYKHFSRARGYRTRLLIFLFVSDDRNPLQLRPFTSYKL